MDKVIFDAQNSHLSFDGKVIVDLSKVQDCAKATLYSGVTADFTGFETEFQMNASNYPFDLRITTLSPTGLIKAIVENRLEVEGMVVSTFIQEVYSYLDENDPLLKLMS